ncbi:hypothetical protein J2X76_003682 [Neorhizobium sp. 2083]|uniref:hypothetical protein n=1 Tax=Neorhizobium sp. 2083 TaxID=2817762 RepID=UPI002860588C|nr:hypothetical protein [Neorhizobium sp. 2083]MDR6818505.1 hypothetical protein [Neorhizobium sp. 2083]
MAKVNAPVYSLNGGEVGEEALARLDLERLQFAGALYSNMMPRVIGSMTLCPGMEHIADINIDEVLPLEYSYSGGSNLVPVLSNLEMRIIRDNGFVSRVAVATAITNGDFASFTGWTNASTGTATAGVSGGNLVLTGAFLGRAVARQTLTVAGGDQAKEHGLRITVVRGPVNVRIGAAAGGSSILTALALDDGEHSLAFTPNAGTIYLEISNDKPRPALVDRCVIEGSGVVVIPTPWTAADLAANIIRYEQHKDVIYVASGVYQQRMIQRRSDTGWGVQRYKVEDGPFVASDVITALQPDGYVGVINLLADRDYFDSRMIGRLYRLFQSGQAIFDTFAAAPAEGAYIRVSGVGGSRTFNFALTGTWVGKVRLQVATDDGSGSPGAWSDVNSFTSNVSSTYTDGDNNVIKYFRWVIVPGELTSGSVDTSLIYGGGSQTGVARIVSITNAQSAVVEVLSRFYSLGSTFEWDQSSWSDYDGWPSAIENFGGRLYWAREDMINGSVPDQYKSFDDAVEGDSAPIARSTGASTDRGVLWLLGLQRLLAGTDVSEISIKSSSFDEPLTASNWFPVEASTRGCKNLRAVKCDSDGIFVQSSGIGAFALAPIQGSLDYGSTDLMAMHEEICDGFEIVDLAVQRRPDTIIWFILSNGEARALTYEPAEKVVSWWRRTTQGQIKRVIANRGGGEDNVCFAVNRNGAMRFEKLASLRDCRGGLVNCLADGFTRFTATAAQTTFSVPHLDGMDVTVWANGVALYDQDDLYTVAGGNVVLPAQSAGVSVVIGLPYNGDYQSTKLAYGAQGGTALFQPKKLSQLGIYLLDTAIGKVRAGKDFDSLRQITETNKGKPLQDGEVIAAYDADMMPVSSDWNTDSRLCLRAQAPYPFTAGALVLDVKTNG